MANGQAYVCTLSITIFCPKIRPLLHRLQKPGKHALPYPKLP